MYSNKINKYKIVIGINVINKNKKKYINSSTSHIKNTSRQNNHLKLFFNDYIPIEFKALIAKKKI